jgi:hypothetical protein
LFDGGHLAALELADPDRMPALGSADHGAEHEFQDRFLTEGVGNHLQPPALFDEQPLEKVGGPDGATMITGNRKCTMHASKSSMKLVTALASVLP